ncbi:MAG: FAD-dependent oxidoreductase [Chitinophagales bacterium]|nr:FAD-binding oxidoreductase [Bacteroidota bacterium]MBK8488028.1 FAD-binding oxidoreductase [Bacteroidota bacterium]
MNLISGYPYWLVKNGLPYNYPSLEKSIEVDVVIMGAGISGALMGYYLANAGVNCVIIDARSIGLGSTCASTALLQYEIDISLTDLKEKIGVNAAERSYKLCASSIHKLHTISEHIGFKEFEFKKSLYYAADKKHIPHLQKEFDARRQAGFDVEYLGKDDVKKTFGFNAPGAILSGLAAQTDAYKFAHELHKYSQSKGIQVFDRTNVTNIQHKKSGVVMKTENGLKIKAKKLIYATGYETVKYIDKKIVELYSTYASITEQKKSKESFWKDDVLIWNTADPYLYIRTTLDGRIIFGGGDDKHSSVDHSMKKINKKNAQLYKELHKVFPSMDVKPEFNWMGIFGKTTDGLPYIGTYKKLPNSLFALGFGGNGITFSLTAAEILTDIILEKKNSDADLFSFER